MRDMSHAFGPLLLEENWSIVPKCCLSWHYSRKNISQIFTAVVRHYWDDGALMLRDSITMATADTPLFFFYCQRKFNTGCNLSLTQRRQGYNRQIILPKMCFTNKHRVGQESAMYLKVFTI